MFGDDLSGAALVKDRRLRHVSTNTLNELREFSPRAFLSGHAASTIGSRLIARAPEIGFPGHLAYEPYDKKD